MNLVSATQRLRSYVKHSKKRLCDFNKKKELGPAKGLIDQFLRTTMDETRIRAASEVSEAVLDGMDAKDAEHFRRALLRREASNDLSFSRQRDHTAHTINNWLLGWFIFDRCDLMRGKIKQAIRLRKLNAAGYTCRQIFSYLWPYVSLLHDVGYIFEGAVDPIDRSFVSPSAQRGYAAFREYFDWQMWIDLGIWTRVERDTLLSVARVRSPTFGVAQSLSAIAGELRDLGDVSILKASLGLANHTPEAFAVWKDHYERHNSTAMVARLAGIEAAFVRMMTRGSSFDQRLLDHAVASGLVLLQYTTIFYQLIAGVRGAPPTERNQPLARSFLDRFREGYDLEFWSDGLVWATAATAIHNLQQCPEEWKKEHTLLGLDEDPLAYLGVLVDILQEWDRYSSSRGNLLAGRIPIQGTAVMLGTLDGKIVIKYPGSLNARVKAALSAALKDWELVVELVE